MFNVHFYLGYALDNKLDLPMIELWTKNILYRRLAYSLFYPVRQHYNELLKRVLTIFHNRHFLHLNYNFCSQ